jgi:hypothetical protein
VKRGVLAGCEEHFGKGEIEMKPAKDLARSRMSTALSMPFQSIMLQQASSREEESPDECADATVAT